MGVVKKIEDLERIKSWKGELPVESLYTAGIAGEKFFRAIKEEGKFLATYCPKCDFVFLPPKIYCEFCFETLTEWREIPNRGRLEGYTILFLGPDGKELSQPELVGLIRMENTDTVIVHRLGEMEPEEIEIGMELEAVFKREREGEINDILYFRPLEII
ncbi:MAG: Zn-ribbon domain-containing OB-fold protein [candidate division WOR-3 bacterium]